MSGLSLGSGTTIVFTLGAKDLSRAVSDGRRRVASMGPSMETTKGRTDSDPEFNEGFGSRIWGSDHHPEIDEKVSAGCR